MSELITLEEQAEVLDEAISLIKEPESWRSGMWKCPLYESDKDGKTIYDIVDGMKVPRRACDRFNRELSQYCVEGAVNQAVYTVLGEDRARELGAYRDAGDDENHAFSGPDSDVWPTDLLGIDELARKRYSEICGDESHAALTFNDYHDGNGKDSPEGHKKIVGLLKTRRTQIRKALSKTTA